MVEGLGVAARGAVAEVLRLAGGEEEFTVLQRELAARLQRRAARHERKLASMRAYMKAKRRREGA